MKDYFTKGISMKILGFLVAVFVSASALAFPLTPNPQWTTGEVCTPDNRDFREYRYGEKIPYCVRNVSSETKAKIYDLYKIPLHCRYRYTIDHFIPLSVGGDNSPANLWPEHKLVKQTRMSLEEDLFEGLKAGTILQKDAINEIVKIKTTLTAAAPGSGPCDQVGFNR
jgi:hypothetical protein